MEKMTKTAKRLDTLVKVLFWLCVVSSVFAVLFLGSILMMEQEHFQEIIASDGFILNIQLGNLVLYFSNVEMFPADGLYMQTIMGWILMVGASIVCCYILSTIRKLLKPMTEGRPFTNEVSVTLKKLAWIVLIIGIIGEMSTLICGPIINQLMNVEQLLLNDNISKIGYSHTTDMTFLVLFFVLLLLSYIFKYGEVLQQQADETL